MMSHRKHPREALLKDLKKVFDKHKWSGNAIGIALSAASSENMATAVSDEAAAGSGGCPVGQTLHFYKYQLPNGKWVFKTYCA